MPLDPDHRPILPPPPDTSPLRRYGHEYTHDVGTEHVRDREIWLALREMIRSFRVGPNPSQKRIGRYLDGEEEVEGLYR